jgi:two-component system response regulator DevR
MLRVLVVDDRADVRQVFAAVLDGQPDLEVVGQAGSLADAGAMLEGVDVALLDRGLPDGDGLKLMRPLREANPHARVLVMSMTAQMSHPEDAIEAGADGVIDKLGPSSGCSRRSGTKEAAGESSTRLIHPSTWKVNSAKPDFG